MASNPYTRELLTKQAESIVDLTTSPQFLNELKGVLNTPGGMQLNAAAKRFSPENLAALGLNVPPNTRISSRVFDEATGASHVLGDPLGGDVLDLNVPKLKLNPAYIDSLIDKNQLIQDGTKNWSACVCVGAGGCVGVGGGT